MLRYQDFLIPKMPEYSTQRDNYDTKGNPEFSSQCFIESMKYFWNWIWDTFMDVSYDINDRAYYAIVMSKLKKGETRYDWDVHKRILNEYLEKWGLEKRVDYFKTLDVWNKVRENVLNGIPVVTGINISNYLPGAKGHIICIVGFRIDENGNTLGAFVHDPYGNARSKYKDHDGSCILYPSDDLIKMIGPDSHSLLFVEKNV
ncbi:MAG: C39 family peptidase [Leptospiraceae bacterium]|nr:C39 family peptidase [Leptospiraceae bacterium]NUM41338.1 C39 family peptidase [Leptospiraceae bacterium]